jgi:hypothetical protein
MKKNIIISIVFLSFLFSCNTLKVKNLNTSYKPDLPINTVDIIGSKENIKHNGVFIGDIVLKSNEFMKTTQDFDWIQFKTDLEQLAKMNGANLLEIDTIGYAKKGQLFYLDGKLYNTKEKQLIDSRKKNPECSIILFRDRLESLIGSAYKINIKANNDSCGLLTKEKPIYKNFPLCHDKVVLTINKSELNIDLDNHTKYFRVSKQSALNPTLGTVGVNISSGGIKTIEILNKELGNLLWVQNN